MIRFICVLFSFLCITQPSLAADKEPKQGYSTDIGAQDDKPLTPDDFDKDKTNHYLTELKKDLPKDTEFKASLPDHFKDFIEKYERIKWYKDIDALEDTIHPASNACENERNRDYFGYIREFYLSEILPREYHAKLIEVDKEKQWKLKERLNFPLPPTHILYIEYKDGNYIEGLQRFLREETYPKLRVYELVKCPDEETLKQFRAREGIVDFTEPPEIEPGM